MAGRQKRRHRVAGRRRRPNPERQSLDEFRWLVETLFPRTGWQREEILMASLCCRPSPTFGESGFDGRYRAQLLASLDRRVGSVSAPRLRGLCHQADGDFHVALLQVRAARRRVMLSRALTALVENLAVRLSNDEAEGDPE